jgi:hypothetical protein
MGGAVPTSELLLDLECPPEMPAALSDITLLPDAPTSRSMGLTVGSVSRIGAAMLRLPVTASPA